MVGGRRRRVVWSVACFVLTVAPTPHAGAAQADRVPRSPRGLGGAVEVIVTSDLGLFAGGVTRLSDGTWYAVYQRNVPDGGLKGSQEVFGRPAANLSGPFGSEEYLAGGPAFAAYDPGTVSVEDGGAIVTLHHSIEIAPDEWAGLGIFTLTRFADGSHTVVSRGFTDGRGTSENTVGRVNGRILDVYEFKVDLVDSYHYQVRVRHGSAADRWDPPAVAGEPAGRGTSGGQTRATAAATGLPLGVIVVWARPSEPPGGDRTIWGSVSADDGQTFGRPFRIARRDGFDLVNPFVVPVGREVRVYFLQKAPGLGSALAMASSTDGGLTWSPSVDVLLPPEIHGLSRPVFVVQDGAVLCFCGWSAGGVNYLGTFQV
jgi:hypothetical protein